MVEFFAQYTWIVWMLVAGLFLVIEAMTVGLVSIWFVPGAIVAAILSIWVDSFFIQLAVFLVISGVTLYLGKKFFKKTKSEKLDEANELLVGKTAVAQSKISPIEGKVLIGDVYWRAVSDDEINEGDRVTVASVEGNILTVKKR